MRTKARKKRYLKNYHQESTRREPLPLLRQLTKVSI